MNFPLKTIPILIALSFAVSLKAQCNFDSLQLNNPHLATFEQELNRKTPLLLRGAILIPVVVHIVWRTPEENISDAAVHAQLSILNKDFNTWNTDLDKVPTEFKPFISNSNSIHFCLATKDALDNPTTGIIRKQTTVSEIGLKDSLFSDKTNGSTAWNTQNYLNIWVANTSDLITGRGSLPLQVSADKDGVVVHPRYFGYNSTTKFGLGRVAVHEVAHYLGLYHLWGIRKDTVCATDFVTDTPPQRGAYYNCPTTPQYSCGVSNMFMNYMDYVDDPCMVFFTKGQMERMVQTIQTFRKELMANDNKCASAKPDNSFSIQPNPFSHVLIVSNHSDVSNFKINIYDIIGRLLLTKNSVQNDKEIILKTNHLPIGMYVLTIETNGKFVFSQKLIKL